MAEQEVRPPDLSERLGENKAEIPSMEETIAHLTEQVKK